MVKTVSIEKCLDVVPNKFNLSLLAMTRAKRLMLGAKSNLEFENYSKNSYKALKEIETSNIDLNQVQKDLKEKLLNSDLFTKETNRDDMVIEGQNNFDQDIDTIDEDFDSEDETEELTDDSADSDTEVVADIEDEDIKE